MSESPRTYGPGALVAAVVIALAVGFYAGTVFMELKAPAAPAMQAGQPAQMEPAGQAQQAGRDGHDHTAELARIKELEQLTLANLKDQALWIELGNLYFDTHQARKSIDAYNKAVALAPVGPDVWTDLGIMHREAKEPAKAIECFDAALKLDPQHKNALYNKGVVLLHDQQDRAGAAEAWGRLLKADPQAKTPDGRPLDKIVSELRK